MKLDTVCIEKEDTEEVTIEGMRILLVEDNKLNLEVAQYILEDAGGKVSVAKNGLEALECFKQSSENYFDAVLMDVMMSVMDGLTGNAGDSKIKKKRCKNRPDHCDNGKCI